jgi:hypothetical protein
MTGPTLMPSTAAGRPSIAGGVFRAGLIASASTSNADLPRDAANGMNDDRRCAELLNITRPKLVTAAHRRLLSAGANVLFTNTSGAAPHLLDRYRMHDEAFAVSYLGAEIASNVALSLAREGGSNAIRPQVVGDVRMPWHMPAHGFISSFEVEAAVSSMTSAQIAGGVDAIRLQASQHPAHLAAAFNGARAGMAEARRRVPVLVSVRHDALGDISGGLEILDDLIAASLLARSLGAAALSIDTLSLGDAAWAGMIELANAIQGPLFLAPGAPDPLIRRCVADPTIAGRLSLVGVEEPARAWRLSRFMPAMPPKPAPVLKFANDNPKRDDASLARAPRIGIA